VEPRKNEFMYYNKQIYTPQKMFSNRLTTITVSVLMKFLALGFDRDLYRGHELKFWR